jgi:hypothetical protein
VVVPGKQHRLKEDRKNAEQRAPASRSRPPRLVRPDP